MAFVLENHALPFLRRLIRRAEYGSDSFIEHVLQALLSQSRTLEILDSCDLFGHSETLRVRDRSEFTVPQLFQCVFVVSKIKLGSHLKTT